MFPKTNDAVGRAPRSRSRHLRRSVIVAVSASLLGASALTTSASAANDGSQHAASQSRHHAATGGLLHQAQDATVTGTADDGTPFNGTFTVAHFEQRNGKLYAVGHLVGTLGHKHVSKPVSLPVMSGNNNAPAQGLAMPHGLTAPAQAIPGACSILTLVLAPLDLNLLGLHVHLNEVNLLIEAVPGAGNLLGNLLCSVAGLLDGG